MTHEYVIALNGHIEPDLSGDAEETAVAWATDAVLAVGPDDVVRAISRGDSTFLDLGGCVVTPLPEDLADAASAVRERARRPADIGRVLVETGLLGPGVVLEPGAPADFAFWALRGSRAPKLAAIVRDGHFTEGDEHRGPFPPPR